MSSAGMGGSPPPVPVPGPDLTPNLQAIQAAVLDMHATLTDLLACCEQQNVWLERIHAQMRRPPRPPRPPRRRGRG